MNLVKTAFKYLKKYPVLTGLALFSIVMMSFTEGLSFGMLIPLIQSMIGEGPSDALASMTFILLLLCGVIFARNLFMYFSNVLVANLRFSITRDFQVSLMSNLIEYDMAYFDRAKTGHIMNVLTNETRRMGEFMLHVLQFVALSGRVIAFVILLCIISFRASIVIFFLIGMVLLLLELIMKKLKKIGFRISGALSDYTFKLNEILNGMRLIKGSVTERSEMEEFGKRSENLRSHQYKGNKYTHLLIPLSESLIFALIVLLFLVLVRVAKIDVPSAFPFIATYLVVLTRTLTQLNTVNSRRAKAIANFAAFRNYEEIHEKKGKKTIESGKRVLASLHSSIEFKDVDFSYDGTKGVLKNMNVTIPKGKITAIVGVSGSGKSTMVNLIPRFYDVTKGKVLIDGVNVRDLDLDSWRKKIGLVSQDTFIFNADVKYNISYGQPDADEEKIVRASEVANAHGYIKSLPQGYNTVLGERGVKLSGGEKQRLSIARAVMNDPEVLILDEATSSLDTETERLIQEALLKLTKGRTVIAIAHRLSTVLHADQILVLHEGEVVERGSHAELLEKCDLYKKLYDTQFGVLERPEEGKGLKDGYFRPQNIS